MAKTKQERIQAAQDTIDKTLAGFGPEDTSSIPGAPPAAEATPTPTTVEPAAAAPGGDPASGGAQTPSASPAPQDNPAPAALPDGTQGQEPTAAMPGAPHPLEGGALVPPDIAHMQSRYDNLRSHADRVSRDNSKLKQDLADLRRENAELKQQVQVLLYAPSGGPGTPAAAAPTTPPSTPLQAPPSAPAASATTPTDVTPPAAPTSQDQFAEAMKSLEAAAAEYPDVMNPIMNAFTMLVGAYENRIGEIDQSVRKVTPVIESFRETTRQNAISEEEAALREHFGAIDKGCPGWRNLVYTNPIDPASERNPKLYEWLQSIPEGHDYHAALFPDPGTPGGTAPFVVKILNEFQASPFGKTLDAQLRTERIQDAQGNLQGGAAKPTVITPIPQFQGDIGARLKAGGQITYGEMQSFLRDANANGPQAFQEAVVLLNEAQGKGQILHQTAPGVAAY
jgi:hypothetical protein